MQCSWIERINIVKMSIILKAICRFIAIPIKMPIAFLHRTGTNFKIYIETQKTLNSQNNHEKDVQMWGIIFPDFKLYYKAMVIKTLS